MNTLADIKQEQSDPAHYRTARHGSGKAVHAIWKHWQCCGAGVNTIGTRRNYGLRFTTDAVTCKSCLRELAKRGITADLKKVAQ